MLRPPKKKRPTYLWNQLLARVTVEQMERHLDSQPVSAAATSQRHRCQLCLGNIDGHQMRYRLLECRSAACATAPESAGVCTAWIKTLSCMSTDTAAIFHHGAHAAVDQTTLNRMTLQMKRFTKNLVINGARPMAILSEIVDQLQLTQDTVPYLAKVQRTAYHHKRVLLMATALVSQMCETVPVLWYREDLDETTPFTFACPVDDFGIPEIGNGSEDRPFLVGVMTKRQVRNLYRATDFLFHIDATYKVNQSGYPMVVCGTSDASRSMHVAAVFLTSHLRQAQYTQIFARMFAVYRLVTGTHLSICYVMGDADDAQFNGFEEAVVSNSPGAKYLICFFHVMLNVKKKAKQLSAPDRNLVHKHVYRIHQARDQFEAEAESAIGHAKTNNPLEQFNKTLKRDYTLRQLLPLNSLMAKMRQLCKTKSVVVQDFKEASVVTADLPRRLKYLHKAGLLSHNRVQRASLNFLMDGSDPETHILVKQHGVEKRAFPLTRSDQARLPSLYMETYKQPRDGWLVNIAERRCPCSWWFKNGCCVHLIESLEIVGVGFHEGNQAEETFVSQRHRRRVAPLGGDEEMPERGGRPMQVGPALALE